MAQKILPQAKGKTLPKAPAPNYTSSSGMQQYVNPQGRTEVTYGTARTSPTQGVLGSATGPSSGGYAGGGAPAAPVNQSSGQNYEGLIQQAPQQPQIDFDAMIRPALDALSAYEPQLQQGYEANVGDINAAATTQRASNQSNIDAQSATLNQAKSTQTQLGENAVDEARRQYGEIQQGLQSRYGGTTGTGAFASELAGRQTLQNIGKIREGLSSAMLEIDNKLQQVQEIGRISSQDIEDKTRASINQAKSQLDAQLQQIRLQKGELQANKASMAANAIQLYQQTVQNVNAQNTAFKQNLYVQQVNAENQLKAAQQQAQKIATSYQGQDYSGLTNTGTPVTAQTFTNQTPTAGGQLGQSDLYKKYSALGGGGAF